MSKIETLDSITTGYLANEQIDSNFTKIATALENTISRDGSTPNTMTASFDSNSQRVINVASPVDNSDAATKGWVTANYSSFDVNTAIGDAEFISTAGSTARSLATRFSDFVTPQDFGALGDGATDDTAAFTSAIATGKVVIVPAATYIVGDVPFPTGSMMIGFSGKSYSTTIYSKVILRRVSGATAVIDVSGCFGGYISGLCMDGVDKGTHGICAVSGDAEFMTIENCTTRFCDRGMGGLSGNHIRASRIHNNTMNNNVNGLRDIIDTHVVNNVIAANTDDGISLQTGNNDCMIVGNKIEFNEGHGITIFSASNITISSNVIDRSYKAGIRYQNAIACTTTGNMLRRNGRNAVSGEQSHFRFGGTSANLTIGNNVTATGTDDGGGGGTTPAYMYQWDAGHSTDSVNMSNNDFVGFVTAEEAGTRPTANLVIDNNLNGTEQVSVGQILNKQNGRVFLDNQDSGTIASAGNETLSFTQPAINTFANLHREMTVWVRNSSTGSDYSAKFNLAYQRESGTATISASTVYGEFNTAGAITVSGSGTIVDLIFTNIATDGSTFDIAVTNNHGSQSIKVGIEYK